MDNLNPLNILNDLKREATSRRSKSLDILNSVLEKQSKSNTKDFSIVTVGKLSEKEGGPSTQTIRNKTGSHYQQLISAWAAYSGTTTKKPLSLKQKKVIEGNDYDVVAQISDPVVKAIVGSIIADKNRYRDQLNTLKKFNSVVIDNRKNDKTVQQELEGLKLTGMELTAIQEAISDDFFSQQEWTKTAAGQVKNRFNMEIYKHGYVNALQKVIGFCSRCVFRSK